MRKFFIAGLLLAGFNALAQDTITTARIKEFVGKEVWVKGKIASIKPATPENDVIYINVDKAFPDNVFTVVLASKYAQRLKLNLAKAKGRNIVVKGKITLEAAGGTTPQMMNPLQVNIK